LETDAFDSVAEAIIASLRVGGRVVRATAKHPDHHRARYELTSICDVNS
jgi:hypothetical protein